MQALFILSLFGVIYTTIAVMTTMLATSSMQLKLQRVEAVKEMFIDIEDGITKGYLGNNVDFNALAFSLPGNNRIDASIGGGVSRRLDNFVSEYISWTGDQLLVDPWGTEIYIGVVSVMQQIYADTDNPVPGNVNSVRAPITVFTMVSAGPDKQFGTDPAVMPTVYNNARRYTSPANTAAEDDIVHIFTTFTSMNEMWNYTQNVHEKMMSVATDNYKQAYELFAPTIQTNYYDVVNFYDSSFNWIGDNNAPGCSTALIHAWKDDNCTVPNVTSGNLTGLPGFPIFPDTTIQSDAFKILGLDEEIKRLLQLLTPTIELTRSSSPNGLNDQLDFVLEADPTNDWTIIYEKRLKGEKIISGL